MLAHVHESVIMCIRVWIRVCAALPIIVAAWLTAGCYGYDPLWKFEFVTAILKYRGLFIPQVGGGSFHVPSA